LGGKIPILRYGLSNVLRNRRRGLAAILGVVLAVTLLAGLNISVDAIANSMMMNSLESEPFDFAVSTNNDSYNEVISALTIEDVSWVDVTTSSAFVTLGTWNTEDTVFATLSGVRPESEDYLVKMVNAGYKSFQEFIDIPMIQGFSGYFNISRGGILLQQQQAETLGVGVGDTIYLENTIYTWNGTGEQNETYYYNTTVTGIISFQVSEMFGSIDISSFIPNAFFHIDDRDSIIEDLNLTYFLSGFFEDPIRGFGDSFYSANYTYFVWVDRSKLVTIGDLDNTKRNYVVMERSLKRALSDIGIEQSDYSISTASIIETIEEVNAELMVIRLVYIAVLIPALALGVYLSLIAVEVSMTRRMKELGILKTRGATSKQLLGLLLTESVILGIIAGVIGLVLGILVSKLFISVSPIASSMVENIYDIHISIVSIILIMIFSITMVILASYRSAKRIVGQSEVEMLRYQAGDELKVPYKPTVDLIFVGIAIFTFILMFILRSGILGSPYSFFFMLDDVLIVLTPLSAFFFIIGLTRLLTRWSPKIYDKASRSVKFMTKDLWHIVNRNIVRNPRRASSVCLIIAIGLAFGMIASTFMETQEKYAERIVVGNIGGDLAIYVGFETNMSFADNISAVEGVELLTPVVTLFTSNFEGVIAFNSSVYYDIVEPEQYFFTEGDARQSIENLNTKGNVIINSKMAKDQYLNVGDEFDTDIYYTYDFSEPESHTFSIIGIAKTLPGLGDMSLPYVFFPQIYTDLDNLNLTAVSNGSFSLKFLVKVDDGYDSSLVADQISDMYPSDIMFIQVLKEELEEFQEDPIVGALYNFLVIIYFFVILILAIGLGLVVYVATVERENELAGFIARGASTKQVGSLLFGEGVTIMLVGVLIGVFTGLVAAYMFNELFSFTIGSSPGGMYIPYLTPEVAIERVFVVSWLTFALIFITILSLLIAGFIATLKARRIKVAKVLRERSG